MALTENTIPAWQWPVCAQKNHNGVVASLIPIFHCGKVVVPLVTAMKPELIPTIGGVTEVFCIWVQGAANVDCVAVWLVIGVINVKVTVSPASAVIFDGVKILPPVPTMMGWSVAETREAATRAVATIKRIISIVDRISLRREKEWVLS